MAGTEVELTSETLETFRERLRAYLVVEQQVTRLPNDRYYRGGFGEVTQGVFRATLDPDAPQENVAVKILYTADLGCSLEVERRLLREAYIWSLMDHRNVAELKGYHFGKDRTNSVSAWLLSPWAVRGTITNHVQAAGLSTLDRLRLVQGAAAGLTFLHSRNPAICHGDLKPENVLVNGEHEALLTDFGLSAIVDDAELAPLTPTGSIRYMSPEMLDTDPREPLVREPPCDIWALGWLVWETLTGQIPFAEVRRTSTIIKRTCSGKLPDPHAVNAISLVSGLPDMVQRCWATEPDKRPTSAQVSTELEIIVSQMPILSS